MSAIYDSSTPSLRMISDLQFARYSNICWCFLLGVVRALRRFLEATYGVKTTKTTLIETDWIPDI